MKKLLSLGIVATLLVSASAAFAFPTIVGPSGGYQVPTTEIAKGYVFAVDQLESATPQIPNIRVLAGVFNNVEIGALYEKVAIGQRNWGFNAKYALPSMLLGTKVAVGGTYLKTEGIGATSDWTGYLSADTPLALLQNCDATVALVAEHVSPGGNDVTTFSPQINLAKKFDNGSVVGLEWLFNHKALLPSDFTGDGGNFYATYPLAEGLTVRFALNGLNVAANSSLGLAYAFGAK